MLGWGREGIARVTARRVLIAESEAASRRVVYRAVESAADPVEIVAATTGAEALSRADRKGAFDLIVLDIQLPDMDGYDVLKALRRVDETVPVVMLTALGEVKQRLHGLAIDSDDLVSKPVSLDALRTVLTRFLSGKESRDLPAIDPGNHHDWLEWRTAEVSRAGGRIRQAREELLARGVIDQDGRRKESKTPADMKADSKTDLTT